MKKLICLMMALLFVCGVAFAQGTPSITIGDLSNSLVKAENLADAAAAGMFVEPLNEFSPRFMLEEYQELIQLGADELEKLMTAEKVTDYFGNVIVDSTGETRALLDLFDGNEPVIYEFAPIIAGGYQVSYGHVTATLLFATPYNPGDEVAVLIGIVNYGESEDEETTVEWHALKGTCVTVPEYDDAEGIEVRFTPEMMTILQDVDTLVAIASLPFDFE